MSAAWPTLVAVLGTLLGGLLGHLYAMRSQRLQWSHEEKQRREQREHVARLDFRVQVQFVAIHRGAWVVELVATVENKGRVGHEIDALEFELRALLDSDSELAPDAAIDNQVSIPHVLLRSSWIPSTWNTAIFEPGVPNTYSFVSSVPQTATVVLLHGHAVYTTDERIHHSAEVLAAVPASCE